MELPYAPRAGQLELLRAIQDAQVKGGHAVLEAPTGTGKTIAALVASLGSIAATDRKLIYATRTNSQQAQVMSEHHAIRTSGQDPGLLIPFMGRRHYCPLLADDERFRDGTAEELGRLCSDAKKKATVQFETGAPQKGACPYYAKLLEDGVGPVEALLRSGMAGPELGAQISATGSCPYEALKLLMPQATAVVVPTVFVIDDRLRATLLAWLGITIDQAHLLLDEAHNLPSAVQEHHSPRLAASTIQRAVHEAEQLRDPVLAGRILTTSFLHALTGTLLHLADEFILADADDGLVPTGSLEERLMERLRVPSTAILQAAADLETWGNIVREKNREKGRLPRSYLGAVGAFLHGWWGSNEAPYAHLVELDPAAVEAFLLEPSVALGWLHDCASTVHLSGTLAPGVEHAALCGLPDGTDVQAFSSPFDAGRLQISGLLGVHRRWQAHHEDPRHGLRQQEAAMASLARMPGRTALWFPSHAMLRDWVEEGFLHGMSRPIFQERPDMDNAGAGRLVHDFKSTPGALLLGVLGGRMSEGIDFPGDALDGCLILGIPYPKPSARLQAVILHQDRVHDGQGWAFAVHNPVGRKIRQAIGRMVRGPEDSGHAVVLDERVSRFGPVLPGLRMVESVGAAFASRPSWSLERAQGNFHSALESQPY